MIKVQHFLWTFHLNDKNEVHASAMHIAVSVNGVCVTEDPGVTSENIWQQRC